ncbi:MULTISPECIES: helix-turn-helix transcriptional regulator [unclassified Actinoplanes]|uniref:helix-turn-helix domain-containing protein n=1 Tax=unclassified Actinoplanes TaxID=2626549 RepID=UPI001E4204F4|nr:MULTISPECIES: helix-turn-helix transcriptional regulator [unclassified Actinoplanes]
MRRLSTGRFNAVRCAELVRKSLLLNVLRWAEAYLTRTHVRRLRPAAELTRLRRLRELSFDQLARAAGLPRTTVSRLEKARKRPDADDVMRLLQASTAISGSSS